MLLVPDRGHTVDTGRAPTPLAHVLDEHRRGVTAVDDTHIREFCAALYAGPVIHPPEVRDWHDPERLDDERLKLHRRRSIHVHCWSPEEFATLLVGIVASGLGAWTLSDLYLRDDLDADDGIEFGLALERPPVVTGDAVAQAAALATEWAATVASNPRRDPARMVRFAAAIRRDLESGHDVAAVAVRGAVFAAAVEEIIRLRARVTAEQDAASTAGERARAAEARADAAEARATAADEAGAALRASRSFRVASRLSAIASAGRRVVGRQHSRDRPTRVVGGRELPRIGSPSSLNTPSGARWPRPCRCVVGQRLKGCLRCATYRATRRACSVAASDAVRSWSSLPVDLRARRGREPRDGSRDHGSASDTVNGAEADGRPDHHPTTTSGRPGDHCGRRRAVHSAAGVGRARSPHNSCGERVVPHGHDHAEGRARG